MSNTLIVTTINPYSRLEHQKRCFERWKSLGLTVRSYNIKEEKNDLVKAGFDTNDIEVINQGETAKGLFGKPLPRILPVLNRAIHTSFSSIVIANSDIYPAVRKSPFELLLNQFGQIAFTRNELTFIENYSFYKNNPYRGGLDIFALKISFAKRLFKLLAENSLSERMTFGIPGWDYYLAERMVKLQETMIMDSQFFLHEYHKPTYTQINEFKNYSKYISDEFGWSDGNDSNITASNFVKYICGSCDRNIKLTTMIGSLFGKSINYVQYSSELEQRHALSIISTVMINGQKLIPLNGYESLLKVFILRMNREITWNVIINFFENNFVVANEMYLRLFFLYLSVIIMKMNNTLKTRYTYPSESLHGVAIKQIAENLKGKDRDKYVFDLFAAELIDYKIFNVVLFEYLVYCFDSQNAFHIFTEIYQTLEN